MKQLIVAFSGASRAGKSTLARHLVERTGASFVSFGDFVRSEFGRSVRSGPTTRRELQDYGQFLVSSDTKEFSRRVMADQPSDKVIVLDGLRHVSVLSALRDLYPDSEIKVIFVEANSLERSTRLDAISSEEMASVDSHQVEREAAELRTQAELVVSTEHGSMPSFEVLDSWAESIGLIKLDRADK